VENDFFKTHRNSITYGQTLSDGRTIDLVAASDDEKLDIIVFDGQQSVIVPQLEYDGVLYRPPQLDSSVQRAVRFPLAAIDYGSAVSLLSSISQLSSQHFGLAEESSTISALWVASTWVPEFFAAPPTLCVAGCSTAEMMKFVRFFAAICRRAISVADLSPRLPLAIGPTLLVVGSGSPKKVLGTWRACSYHGVYIPAGRDRLQQLVCPKAIFSENPDAIGS